MGAILVEPHPETRSEPAASASFAARSYPEIMVGGLRVACLSRKGLKSLMVAECLAARSKVRPVPKLVFAANGHVISLAALDADVQRLHAAADLIHADGQPVVFASRLTGMPIPERSSTTDLFHDAADAAAQQGLRFFLLGGTEEVNARCAEMMRERYPGLEIVGRRHGYFRSDDESKICTQINASGADVVWVGLGVPFEQAFCVRNRHRLRAGWLVTAGGCFNYVTGHYKRAPSWMQRAGLEWLHRVWCEPRRLFWRYALTNPHAAFLLLTRTSPLSSEAVGRRAEEPRLRPGLG